jgi:phosphoesterase RecJ-like protein
MDPQGLVEEWDTAQHGSLPETSAMILVDTADVRTTGQMETVIGRAKEVFVIDHHEPGPNPVLRGIVDSTAASTCEMTVELSKDMGVAIDPSAAFDAYIGIAYDTGFFAYPKTGTNTLNAALTLLEQGVQPNDVYRLLHENSSIESLLLQKRALAAMTLHCNNRVAVQVLRLADFAAVGALPEDAEGFVNFPLKARDVAVSVVFKEGVDGRTRCSLRSKGHINVAQIAQEMGGGGHVNASAYKSTIDIERAMAITLEKIAGRLENP